MNYFFCVLFLIGLIIAGAEPEHPIQIDTVTEAIRIVGGSVLAIMGLAGLVVNQPD